MKRNNNTPISNNPMPAKSIRLREDQWTFIQTRHQEFGAENPNAFIRDAIDFYTECMIYLVVGKLKLDCPSLFA